MGRETMERIYERVNEAVEAQNFLTTIGAKLENARYDFLDNIIRVTAGQGGEALLVLGSEKTALVDCGMAYCTNKLLKKIHTVLETEIAKTGKYRSIDYIFATHTHYDHIGAMNGLRHKFAPELMQQKCFSGKVRFKRFRK